MMVMIWVSPYTSLERNVSRVRSLPMHIVLKTWEGVNKNIDEYKREFGDKFILINNDAGGKLEYDDVYAKSKFITGKGSGKVRTPEELVKLRADRDILVKSINDLIRIPREFTSIDDAKSKINNFLN